MSGEFRLGEWLVQPQLNFLVLGEHAVRVEPKVMDVLVYMAGHAGEVLPKERIIAAVWADAFVGDEALTYSISELRKALSDDARSPRFIQTIPRRGYRLIADVAPTEPQVGPEPAFEGSIWNSIWKWGAVAGGVLVLLAAGWLLPLWDTRSSQPAMHVEVAPEGVILGDFDSVVLSPDGENLAFTGFRGDEAGLWIRSLGSSKARPMRGTEGAFSPFWSPDSRFVAFFARNRLMKLEISTEAVLIVADVPHAYSGSWGRRGEILLTNSGRLFRVPETGGELSPIENDTTNFIGYPHFLPDGDSYLYSDFQAGAIMAASLSGEAPRLLLEHAFAAGFVESGYLAYIQQGMLRVRPFDPGLLRFTGPARTIAQKLGDPGEPFSISETAIAYHRSPFLERELVWFDRRGARLSTVEAPPRRYGQLALSLDETRLAVTILADGSLWDARIFILDLKTGVFSPLAPTGSTSWQADPQWSATGDRLAYAQGAEVRIRRMGAARDDLLIASTEKESIYLDDWAKDEKLFLVHSETSNLEWRVSSLAEGEGLGQPWLKSDALVDQSQLSPDGKWVAYGSLESGKWEVYVAAFPEFAQKRQVSLHGGAQPQWRADGSELFYLSFDGRVMSIPVGKQETGEVEFARPEALFDAGVKVEPERDQYAVTKDGQRFLVIRPQEPYESFELILNWKSLLSERDAG